MALITCPECKHQISEHATACPQCGYKLNILTAKLIKLSEKQGIGLNADKGTGLGNTKMTARSSIFTVLGILLVAFVGAAFFASLDKNKPQTAVSNDSKSAAMPGDITTLSVPEGNDIPVAISKEALERLTKLSIAKDTTGISQLMLAGAVWTVPSGTKCLLIDPGVFTYEVRIMEGEHSGRTCFVDRGFIARK